MLWFLPLALGVAGLIMLAVLANRVRRELTPTVVAVDRFGREHRVALRFDRGGEYARLAILAPRGENSPAERFGCQHIASSLSQVTAPALQDTDIL